MQFSSLLLVEYKSWYFTEFSLSRRVNLCVNSCHPPLISNLHLLFRWWCLPCVYCVSVRVTNSVAGTHSHMCRHLHFGSWENRVMAITCSDADRIWCLCVRVCLRRSSIWMANYCPVQDRTAITSFSPDAVTTTTWQKSAPTGSYYYSTLQHTHSHKSHTETHKHLLKTSQLLSKTIAMSLAHIVRSICWSMLTFFQAIKNSSVWTLRSGIIGPL